MEVNKICSRLLIVPDKITHQNIEDIIVNWNRLFETRQGMLSVEKLRSILSGYSDKRTALF